jgi:hypothetical protein
VGWQLGRSQHFHHLSRPTQQPLSFKEKFDSVHSDVVISLMSLSSQIIIANPVLFTNIPSFIPFNLFYENSYVATRTNTSTLLLIFDLEFNINKRKLFLSSESSFCQSIEGGGLGTIHIVPAYTA